MVEFAGKSSDAKKNKFGFAYNLNEPFWFVTFLGAHGTRPLVNAEPKLDNRGMVDALAFVHDLKYKSKVVPPDCDYACAKLYF